MQTGQFEVQANNTVRIPRRKWKAEGAKWLRTKS